MLQGSGCTSGKGPRLESCSSHPKAACTSPALYSLLVQTPGALPWPRGTAALCTQSSGVTHTLLWGGLKTLGSSPQPWVGKRSPAGPTKAGQTQGARMVLPSLIRPKEPGWSHQGWTTPRSQGGPTKPCSVQLGRAVPTQIPLLFRQGWFRSQMRNQ